MVGRFKGGETVGGVSGGLVLGVLWMYRVEYSFLFRFWKFVSFVYANSRALCGGLSY